MAADTEFVKIDQIPVATWNKVLEAAEGGGASAGGLVVNIVEDETNPSTRVMDITAGDLYAALEAGRCVYCKSAVEPGNQLEIIVSCFYDETTGYHEFNVGLTTRFTAQTANDYPSAASGGDM